MGADYQEAIIIGRTLDEAFGELVTTSEYEYGHSGYSGTFAEKGSVVLFGELPPRVTIKRFEGLVHQLMFRDEYTWKRQADGTTVRIKEKLPAIKWPASFKKDKKLMDMAFKFVEQADDKWEAAAAVKLNVKETRDYKRTVPKLRGTRKQIWYVAGYCSS